MANLAIYILKLRLKSHFWECILEGPARSRKRSGKRNRRGRQRKGETGEGFQPVERGEEDARGRRKGRGQSPQLPERRPHTGEEGLRRRCFPTGIRRQSLQQSPVICLSRPRRPMSAHLRSVLPVGRPEIRQRVPFLSLHGHPKATAPLRPRHHQGFR